ncbi:GT-D fold domain-containing glycosyltransferase [Cohnella ginsengisoli]|uniref:GT-D fold domain-containing glycosyltransferase n=1 Tax=Cohnella ginsengisoli TaxID=425004 RepID=A0A9X4KPG5_9BACL|nr:GT-D fold domain-containing glycosyltransferase [Cohnella ginsengisoli]MDG0793847.1 GT-D fold domain-containing glycosyltransferase [Cohnella ginsengisoli]
MTYIELNTGQLMDKILHALAHRLPLSVISVGVTEAHVLAQYTVYSEALFMNHPEADVENRSTVTRGHTHRGIRFPNIEARDAAMEAVRKADIVGISIRVTRSGGINQASIRSLWL